MLVCIPKQQPWVQSSYYQQKGSNRIKFWLGLTQLQMSFTMNAELGTALKEYHARMREVQCLQDQAEEWSLICHH